MEYQVINHQGRCSALCALGCYQIFRVIACALSPLREMWSGLKSRLPCGFNAIVKCARVLADWHILAVSYYLPVTSTPSYHRSLDAFSLFMHCLQAVTSVS